MAEWMCGSVTIVGGEVYGGAWGAIGEYGGGVEGNQSYRQDLQLRIGLCFVPKG